MTTVEHPRDQLAAVRGSHLSDRALGQRAVALAANLLEMANAQQTRSERQQAQKIARMMDDPNGKALTIALSDQVFRSHRPQRIASQLAYLLDGYGVPSYMQAWERGALAAGGTFGKLAPHAVVPPFTARLRQETRTVILPGEEAPLTSYLARRRADGMRLNLNQLGEAILGEEEAQHRLAAYLRLLARPDVEYISVKLSSVFSQINLVAYDETLQAVKERLRMLYRAAMATPYTHPDGSTSHRFINLDMEEYRDLHLTVAAFQQVLDEDEFLPLRAGLVLQAYLPDSFAVQQDLTAWAQRRVARGGAPIKIRIVKGANLAMEQVEASLAGWEPAPYSTKVEVDANFKRMVRYGCDPAHAAAVNMGVASHNLFDIAYSLLVRAMYETDAYVEFEMLEGMANHQARAVQAAAGGMLLYAPVVKQEDFHSAIAYLVRRLDENTAEENFLHDLFALQPDTPLWDKQRKRFLVACELTERVRATPRRRQNRQHPLPDLNGNVTEQVYQPFTNEPDTDWSLPANHTWIRTIVAQWHASNPQAIPLQIGGELITDTVYAAGHDPSRPGAPRYRYALADATWVSRALDVAVQAQRTWGKRSPAERGTALLRVAHELARSRGDLIGAMILDGAKAIPEADGEVSEAIDFARYYARSLPQLHDEVADCSMSPLGVVVITPPWNFPCAIPSGGVLAALAAGNSVILKPAPETVLVAWQIVQAMWRAGIPHEVLQFVPCPDNEIGQQLVTDERTAAVILTGARATALMFQGWKPTMRLFAETSGKNALIITGMADHDQAIKDLVRSAFGHNGQKCSAASLAILEGEVYDNPTFLRQLRDAVASLHVGTAWEPANKLTPLTQPPGDNLCRALTTLDEGESWLLEPRMLGDNPHLWSPGIKIGVRPGSFFHQTECFGPVLGILRADDLTHAVELANASLFGLTGGIHSLDAREQAYWQEHIEVGNAYINRHITGAIVQRQAFGGWKGSVFGPGAKAGGPNYVLQLGDWQQHGLPRQQATPAATVQTLAGRYQALLTSDNERSWLQATIGSYAHAWQTHYGSEQEMAYLHGEDNIFRYRPCKHILLRPAPATPPLTIAQVALAAYTCGTPLTISLPPSAPAAWAMLAHHDAITVIFEDDSMLISRLQAGFSYERLRAPGGVALSVRQAAQQRGMAVLDSPVLANGRLELRAYLREQAVSRTTHRYGNILPAPQQRQAQEV